jgi:hypothetical protein
MQCPSCKTQNNYYHRYCYYCGHKLIKEQEPVFPEQEEIEAIIDNTEEPFYSPDQTKQFDYTEQFPLRRYSKNKSSTDLGWLMKICAGIALLALLAFTVYIATDQLAKNSSKPTEQIHKILATTSVESITLDGKPAHKLMVNTSNGEQVEVLGEFYPVTNGKAEIVYDDAYLYSCFAPTNQDKEIGGQVNVDIDITIYKKGLPEAKEKVQFTLDPPISPLSILQPSSQEALVEGSKYRIILMVEPGSQVSINGNNYSDLVDSEGRLEKEVEVPNTPENVYEIRVVTKGYSEHIQNIVLKRQVMEFPLTIDQPSPIKAAAEWTKITGNTNPQAILEVDLETKFEPIIDSETGNFTLYVKTTQPGYTPCTLTARMEGKKDSVLHLIIENSTTEAEYTSRAWAPEYNDLKANPDLHNGRIFVFEGTVKDIIALGDKSSFIVDIANGAQSPQLIFVECWENTTIRSESKIRLFGNRWGNHEGIPRILAKYIYRY